jgi:hypothetical protein
MKNDANINVRCQEKHKTMIKQLMAFKDESEGFIIRAAVEYYHKEFKGLKIVGYCYDESGEISSEQYEAIKKRLESTKDKSLVKIYSTPRQANTYIHKGLNNG